MLELIGNNKKETPEQMQRFKVRAYKTLCRLTFGLMLIGLWAPGDSQAQPETQILLTSHFDIARQAPIASVVYQHPVAERVFVNGFVEAWWNTDLGLPQEKVTLFSKNWVSYALTSRLSTSVELEFLYNRPGVAIKFPQEITFQEEKVYVIPKIGFAYRVK